MWPAQACSRLTVLFFSSRPRSTAPHFLPENYGRLRSTIGVRGFAERVAELSEAAELALGAARAEHRRLGRIVVPGIVGNVSAPATTEGTLTPALDAAKDYSFDLTPSVSAAAARSAIRASPPFIAWAAATPIIDVSVM